MTNDDSDRLLHCLRALSDHPKPIVDIFTQHCRQALSTMLAAKAEEEASTQKVNYNSHKFTSLTLWYCIVSKNEQ